MSEPIHTVKLSLGLDTSQRQLLRDELRQKWNEKLKDPYAFAPSELRETLTLEEVFDANKGLGRFAASHLKSELKPSSSKQKSYREFNGKIVAGVGYAKGFDSKWVVEACFSGLSTIWIDVSDDACERARADLEIQFRSQCFQRVTEPVVIEGEIHEVLSGNSEIPIDFEKVEIWYLCRVLGCIESPEQAMEVLRLLGNRSLSSIYDKNNTNKIVLVVALRDDNRNRVSCTSKLYKRKQILLNLARGANRKVTVLRQSKYYYFDQLYTAMTIIAEPIGEGK